MSCKKYPSKTTRKSRQFSTSKLSITLHERSLTNCFHGSKINWNHYCVKVLACDNMNHIRLESNTVCTTKDKENALLLFVGGVKLVQWPLNTVKQNLNQQIFSLLFALSTCMSHN